MSLICKITTKLTSTFVNDDITNICKINKICKITNNNLQYKANMRILDQASLIWFNEQYDLLKTILEQGQLEF